MALSFESAGLTQLLPRAVFDRPFFVALIVAVRPQLVDLVAQSVVTPRVLPADDMRDEVDHGLGGRSDDGVKNRVVGALIRGEREGDPAGDVGVVAAAELAFGAKHLAQIPL